QGGAAPSAPAGLGGTSGLPGGLDGLGGLPEGFADQLANLPAGLNFPPPSQGNVPAAFRGGGAKRRDKKK
ncbi:MAG TPA: hypothetical protein VEF71_21635, partial [Streptosporangiaceae bacterium]|nr:hypothetical protein [Streptosporangiaceae bacterium]